MAFNETSAMLTAWKRTDELTFPAEVSSVPLQQGLRHLQGAFTNFFEKRAAYPRFKSRKRGRQSAEYTRSAFRYRDGALTLAKMAESLAIRWSRPLPEGAEPTTVTVSRDAAGRWHVSLLCEVTVHDGPATDAVVGIDAGVTSLVTLSRPIVGLTDRLRDGLPLNVREWECRCGAHHNRDVNAARNIRAAGLAVLACGDGVRPARAEARAGSRR